MRNASLEIKGINRNIGSPDNDAGFCSELINLKPENGLKVVPEKEIVSGNLQFLDIKLHNVKGKFNYIGIENNINSKRLVHFDKDSGNVLQELMVFEGIDSEIYYTFLNYQIVVSDKIRIKSYVFTYKDQYVLVDNSIEFNIDVKHIWGDHDDIKPGSITQDISASTKKEYLQACQSLLNKFKEDHPTYVEGRFMFGFTITLIDGTETGVYNLTPISCTSNMRDITRANAFISISQSNLGIVDSVYTFMKTNELFRTFGISIDAMEQLYEKYKDEISAVNLYVSKPVSRVKIDADNLDKVQMTISFNDGEIYVGNQNGGPWVILPSDYVEDSDFETQLMYHQKTWNFKDFCKGFEYTFMFGGDIQTTGKTMDVYPTSLERAGEMNTYNKRVHYFNSAVRLNPKLNFVYGENLKYEYGHQFDVYYINATCYVYIKTESEDLVLKYNNIKIDVYERINEQALIWPEILIFPDSRAYKMEFITETTSADIIKEYSNKKITVYLTSSPSYNYAYSYRDKDTYSIDMVDFDGNIPTIINEYTESDIINVTEQNSPTVFNVKHSYKFDGNITAVTNITDNITDSQVGQYPLAVFTDNGIYALQQGNGEVLYSGITQLHIDNCTNRNIVNTINGIAYISNDNVYVIKGKQSKRLSQLLNGPIDFYIQNNTSFNKCCKGELYDISNLLSQKRFEEYLQNAKLSYSPTNVELIVSNDKYNYSYVFDMMYNCWYKVSGVYENIDDNIMLTNADVTEIDKTPATGKITLNAIHKEKSKIFNSVCKAELNTDRTCLAGNTVALVINDSQVASATFNNVTYIPMILATLCEKIPYLESVGKTIYSNTDVTQTLKIVNISTNEVLSTNSFTSQYESVSIPNKAIGETIIVTTSVKYVLAGQTLIEDHNFSYKFTEGSSVVTMLNDIAKQINDNNRAPITAKVVDNSIQVISKEKGSKTNNIPISVSVTNSDYIYISTDGNTLSGGQDVSIKPSEYKQIIDWAKPSLNNNTIIHLHTRPVHFENKNSFKIIKQAILNCLSNIEGEQNLSLYIYGSNNLQDWKCISAAQRKNCTIANIITNRTAKAYKYFVFMIGGLVDANTELSNIILTLDDIANNKLR